MAAKTCGRAMKQCHCESRGDHPLWPRAGSDWVFPQPHEEPGPILPQQRETPPGYFSHGNDGPIVGNLIIQEIHCGKIKRKHVTSTFLLILPFPPLSSQVTTVNCGLCPSSLSLYAYRYMCTHNHGYWAFKIQTKSFYIFLKLHFMTLTVHLWKYFQVPYACQWLHPNSSHRWSISNVSVLYWQIFWQFLSRHPLFLGVLLNNTAKKVPIWSLFLHEPSFTKLPD